jgi:Tfp pilus assembly protein PilF
MMFDIFRMNVNNGTTLHLGIRFSIFSESFNDSPSPDQFQHTMHIRRLYAFAAAWCLIPAILFGQALSVQFKVRESRLFGLSGERFATLEFSNQNRTTPLTSENVNAATYFYFVFRPVGDWVIDADFVQEELPKLTLQQNSQALQIAWKGEITKDSTGSLLMIGFSKDLKLHQPFISQFKLADSTTQGSFLIPQEYWPGYPVLMEALRSTERAMEERRYRDGIAGCEQALQTAGLEIFSQWSLFRDRRTQIFELLHNQGLSLLAGVSATDKRSLKEKIAQLDEVKPTFQYILDSLARVNLNVTASDSSVKRLFDHATMAIARARSLRDSLQVALDDQNVRWIIDGSATGKNGDRYQTMIQTLAYAFSSVDFSDTTSSSLSKMTLTPQMMEGLKKGDLEESYTTFIRQCGERLQRRGLLFPPEFLNNLRKDTSSFSLPYYSMLRAVNDSYAGYFLSAREEIVNIFKTCYDPSLSARFDQLRIALDIRQRDIRPEVMKLLDEATSAENAGNNELASEKYRDASRMAPDFAYASYRWGKFFVRTGDPIRAQTFFERAYQADTLYLSAYREAYTLSHKSANYKAMIDILTRALERGNDFWEINFNLGVAYMGDSDLARAIKQFERALELNPRNYQTNVQLGLAHQTAKNFQKARDYFNRAIFIDPIRPEAVDYLIKLDELQKNAR